MQIADFRLKISEVLVVSLMLCAVEGVSSAVGAQQAVAPACSTRAEPVRRVELADGRAVSVDVRSLAMSGDLVMATGDRAYVFPRVTTPRTPPTMLDSVIGVVIEGEGRRVSLVPNPLLPRPVRYPRVADAGNGAFHALFMTTADSNLTQHDSATIWYARYARGAWTVPERVADVRRGSVTEDGASALVARNGELTFVYPIGVASQQAHGGGLVLLRRLDGRWAADTLFTSQVPKAPRVVSGRQPGSYVVTYVQPGAQSSDALYLVRFDATWSPPRRIGGDDELLASLPVLARVEDGVVASWVLWRFMQPHTARLEWLRLDDAGRMVARGFAGSGQTTLPFELVALEGRFPLWLHQGEPYGSTLSLAVAVDSTAVRLPSLTTTPFENPRPMSIAMGRRVLVFTMKQGKAPDEPMVASYTTVLEVRCPRSARR